MSLANGCRWKNTYTKMCVYHYSMYNWSCDERDIISKKMIIKKKFNSVVCVYTHRFIVTAAFIRIMYLRYKCIPTSLMISAKSYLLYANDKHIT